ncbi:UBP1-associated protein 2C-like isoform X2 [Rhodamnia argentea]|uniref:UBP1-associated protein 2C-like isoform X2 n=1 Tax=Rhodamnia argentea TaxID=178133 RepID=A0A8B8QV66_9MYRT|nr:UBP1-associated protein 2C-like isoform X2 [Rhodamnia argentea]XP_048130113.1 UBP1-associated protein 2C-like isoform X2 [Rhodamnia argentea]XP_048130114.1 UBP1-associated protein 2C-like isoform X2 [Rhodamnia argentea]
MESFTVPFAVDLSKKRKLEENNGFAPPTEQSDTIPALAPVEARKMFEPFTREQLLDVLQDAIINHPDVLYAARALADGDATQRKLFVRGLGWETTTEGLRSLFSVYGEIEEAVVVLDKATNKSKGYGFVTFKHVDGALRALREPSKKIDGRVAVTQLAAAGNAGSNVNPVDVSNRKIYVGNVPIDMPSDKLLSHFSVYGEIEEGPLGFDKLTGKSRGFALFVYKTMEGAQAALVDPVKTIDGRQLNCKLAIDGKKKPGAGPMGGHGASGGHGDRPVDGMGMGGVPSFQGSVPGQYGPNSVGGYGGFSGQPSVGLMNSASMGGPSATSMSNQAPSLGGVGGFGAGLGGPYSGYGGHGSAGYGGMGNALGGLGSAGGFGGVGGGLGGAAGGLAGVASGFGGAATGSSLYRPSGGYPEGGNYGLSSSSAYPSQTQQPTGTSPVPRVPQGGMYPNVPPNVPPYY